LGSLKRVSEATEGELAQVPGIPKKTARLIYEALHGAKGLPEKPGGDSKG
jgi:ERCC4-type nuclease